MLEIRTRFPGPLRLVLTQVSLDKHSIALPLVNLQGRLVKLPLRQPLGFGQEIPVREHTPLPLERKRVKRDKDNSRSLSGTVLGTVEDL